MFQVFLFTEGVETSLKYSLLNIKWLFLKMNPNVLCDILEYVIGILRRVFMFVLLPGYYLNR